MLKYALRRHSLNFTDGLSWAQELTEIEAMQKDTIPADMYSYIKNMAVEEDDEDEQWEDEDEESTESEGDSIDSEEEDTDDEGEEDEDKDDEEEDDDD